MERTAGSKKFLKATKKNPILAMCWDKPRKIVEISKELKIKRSTLAYYLDYLETKGLIKRERIQEKATGRPTIVQVIKNKIEKTEEGYNDKFFLEENTFKVLNSIREAKKPLTNPEVEKKANINIGDVDYYLDKADEYGLIDIKYHLTKKGLNFLKKKRTYKPYDELYPNEEDEESE